MNQHTEYTPAALYARVSSDRQDVDPVRLRTAPHSSGRSGTTHGRTATSSPASTWTRPRAGASPTAPSSAR